MAGSALPGSDVWGLLLIGLFLSLILFGIILAQAFTYFQNCERDELWMKLFVGILVMLDISGSAASMAWIYQLLIDGWGNISAFKSAGWPVGMIDLTMPFIGGLVHLFFARRVHIFSGQRWITYIILGLSVLSFCGGIGTGIAAMWIKEFSQFEKFVSVSTIWAMSSVSADIIITVVMTYHLHHSKGNFAATDRLLDRIIQLTVQNCALTSTCEIISIALYYAFDKPYYFATLFLASKFCMNSVLSSLNSRKELRSLANVDITLELGGPSSVGSQICGSDQPQQPEVLEFRRTHYTNNSSSD